MWNIQGIAMHIILIALILLASALIASSSTCQESRQLENNCGSYCFKVVKPVLEYTAKLQKQVDGQEDSQKADTQSRLENIEKQMVVLQEQIAGTQSKCVDIESKFSALKEKVATEERITKEPALKMNDQFESIGSKYYYIEKHRTMNWFEAAYRCQELGGHLASLQNQEEYTTLTAKLNKDHDYWIDINDLSHEGEFLSHTTGRKAPFLYWYNNYQPDNEHNVEHCVHLWKMNRIHRMNDADCRHNLYFICESLPK